MSLIIGRNPIIEALKSGRPIDKIIILHGCHGKPIDTIRAMARDKRIQCVEVNKKKFQEITRSDASQGIAALVPVKEYADLEDLLDRLSHLPSGENPLVLVLDEITDPHNAGALIRTAECAGAHGVIVPRHHSASMTETISKTSAGAIEHLPVSKVVNLASTIDRLKEAGFWIIGTDAEADRRFDEVDYTGATAVIIGSEGKGIRRLIKEKCDFLVRIPLKGKISSLNASVAGAIVMYEAAKQRGF
jgi:23S rRNA (guanosine2251-2'-O)-methyltransferase